MRPVVTPIEMAAIDAEATESLDELIERAGWATARAARSMLGPTLYGRRIAVMVGKGNNGADGRSAARYLERLGARCTVLELSGPKARPLDYDLIIDACFGTGLRRDFDHRSLPLEAGDVPVLAVDIPSGVDGLTGELRGRPLSATATVTFAAAKPGLLLEPGRRFVGDLTVADIGLDCSRATMWWLEPDDVAELWPRRRADAHKWQHAVYVVGGSPGLAGAPSLAATAALRAGAGYAAISIPGPPIDRSGVEPVSDESVGGYEVGGPIEAVVYPVPGAWAEPVLARHGRFGAMVVGPGLAGDQRELARFVEGCSVPTVFDAGAIDGLAALLADRPHALAGSSGPLHVVTPHDGEFRRLTGDAAGSDRPASAVAAAVELGAIVLLKGATTVVAHPDGRVLLCTAGDQRLATAGTGDVLSGLIAAGVAGGLDPFLAAGVAAQLHGQAGIAGYRVGMTAGDLPLQVAAILSELI